MVSKSKLMLVGWDAADWKVIQPLMDAGKERPDIQAETGQISIMASGTKADYDRVLPVLKERGIDDTQVVVDYLAPITYARPDAPPPKPDATSED